MKETKQSPIFDVNLGITIDVVRKEMGVIRRIVMNLNKTDHNSRASYSIGILGVDGITLHE
jgi:hypothetical protein